MLDLQCKIFVLNETVIILSNNPKKRKIRTSMTCYLNEHIAIRPYHLQCIGKLFMVSYDLLLYLGRLKEFSVV